MLPWAWLRIDVHGVPPLDFPLCIFPWPRLFSKTQINSDTFHFSTGSIPCTSHIISCSNDSFVNLHQVETFLSNIATSHFRLIYKDILATSDLVEFNIVEYVWISIIDIKSRKRAIDTMSSAHLQNSPLGGSHSQLVWECLLNNKIYIAPARINYK